MPDRYPGYDVLAKRQTLSWNEITRRVVDRRLATPRSPRFLDPTSWRVLEALCDRIAPPPPGQARLPLAGMVDGKLLADAGDGSRPAGLPPLRDAWLRGLAATDAEASAGLGRPFPDAPARAQDDLLHRMQAGSLHDPAWGDMPPALFFAHRLAHDILSACYAFPASWNWIGFGGPASPRGYVRLQADRRDPWEAMAADPRRPEAARRVNTHVG
jgi:Gluconate 2-dehydrogenase subunit 3